MLQPYRWEFNERQFTPQRYEQFLRELDARVGVHVDFRVCETPCFFPRELLEGLVEAGRALTVQLIDSPEYLRRSDAAIPERYRVPDSGAPPHFMQVDFGLTVDADGRVVPKLVELQAFPSVYGYQEILTQEYVRAYGLAPELAWRFEGMSEAQYWDLLRRTIVADHEPENVVLLEVEPELQKTRADFYVTRDKLGIGVADLTKVRKVGRRLEYERDGRWTRIERIYNRAIVDELERKGIVPAFDYREELDVEWAGNPNWYFRVSKFSIPYLDHPTVPTAVFLDEWLDGSRRGLPEDRENLLLKPLYSFAGKGIQFAPTDAELLAVPEGERHNYLVQERVRFAPVIETPHGPTQAEIRVMYVRPEGEREMVALTSLVRLGRGLMMGVDHNRNQEWVGGSSALFPN